MNFFSIGVLISGGGTSSSDSYYGSRHVELYNPVTNTSCNLPDLPEGRQGHTSVGGVICGGCGHRAPGGRTCVDIYSGSWSSAKYQELKTWACRRLVWNINPGESFMLLGRLTTDIVHYNGNVETGFDLQYDAV